MGYQPSQLLPRHWHDILMINYLRREPGPDFDIDRQELESKVNAAFIFYFIETITD